MIMHRVRILSHINSYWHTISYAAKDPNRIHNEDNMINYFNKICLKGECSAGNFWCTWLTIKSYLMVKHRLGSSTCPLLRRLLIKVASQHVKQK